ncbi:MAG: hypothetical protein WHV44_04460 [Anaerolineales bacterium]
MKIYPYLLALLILLTACAPSVETSRPADTPTAAPTAAPPPQATPPAPQPGAPETQTPPPADDLFAAAGLTLEPPICNGALTPSQAQGPFYTPNTPQRNSLLEPGIPGQRMIVIGYVLDANCQPIPNAWLDFWQTDGEGRYDNQGFKLRGQQLADSQGRYYLETVYPGEYPGRTPHIHVKVARSPAEKVLTTQIYFPNAASNQTDGIFNPQNLVTFDIRNDMLVAYFNFVIP